MWPGSGSCPASSASWSRGGGWVQVNTEDDVGDPCWVQSVRRTIIQGVPYLAAVASVTVIVAGCSSSPNALPEGKRSATRSQVASAPRTTRTTTTTTPASTVSSGLPTLGLTGAWPDGSGFGQVEPVEVYLGGDPSGRITSIEWQSWGGAEATGEGIALYVPPGKNLPEGSTQAATIVAFDLGTCAGSEAYQEVEWYFPGEGEAFNPTSAEFTCKLGYV